MKVSPGSLARSSARHPWRTVIAWIATLIAAGVLASAFLGDALTTTQDFTDDPESKRAAAMLEERLRGPDPETEFVVVTGDHAVNDPDVRGFVGDLQREIEALGPRVVRHVGSFLTTARLPCGRRAR
jgi:uncharacterized membrane protein YdfJ with MMPL/SSD domain